MKNSWYKMFKNLFFSKYKNIKIIFLYKDIKMINYHNMDLYLDVYIILKMNTIMGEERPFVVGIYKTIEEASEKIEKGHTIHGPYKIKCGNNILPMINSEGIITSYQTELKL